ncbi:MAG: GGDEF domain-containing protein, partial [Desulfobacteraceae bacterium]|nr:GGDEF domain-containing protein [Desulfobacteraceae bacterium]
FLGVVGVGLDFDAVADLLDDYKKKYNRNVYVVSPDGLVQIHTDKTKIEKNNIFQNNGIGKIAADILKTRTPAFFEYDADDQHILLTCRYVKELGWHLLVEQNQNQALSAVKRAFVKNIIISLVITLSTILITILTINYFQKRLEILATRDSLTNAFNRNEFERRFMYLSRLTRRKIVKFSIILFDIDKFKLVNDTQGHVFGDKVIKNIADIAIRVKRQDDMLIRWGGDEFILLIVNDIGQGKVFAQRLVDAISQFDFYRDVLTTSDKKQPITISCGIAQFKENDTLDSMTMRADQGLYIAKAKHPGSIEAIE